MSGRNPNKLRKAEQERKREERTMRKAHQSNRQYKEAMSSYSVEDENYAGFSNQLATIGLQLRDIPGDGNCLFRALADQLDGHSRNHLRYREEVVKYMIDHRNDFEPFVEDDCLFDDHVSKLRRDGTYAGNDAIVAFARMNGVNVVIHQLNAPMWTINGNERGNSQQLHIAYHNGDHYSSVRKLNDSSNCPAVIKLTTKSEKKTQSSSKRKQPSPTGYLKKKIQHISNVTGCQDAKLIQQLLDENDYDDDFTIAIILQTMSSAESSEESQQNYPQSTENTFKHHFHSMNNPFSPLPFKRESSSSINMSQSSNISNVSHTKLWDANGTGSRLFGAQNTSKKQETKNRATSSTKKLSNKNRKEQARKERKKRNDDKKKNTPSPNQANFTDSDDSEIVLKNLDILRI